MGNNPFSNRVFPKNDPSELNKKSFNDFFSKIYSGNAKESCEVMLAYDNNPLCLVYMEGIVTGDERKCLLSVVDISGFKKQERS